MASTATSLPQTALLAMDTPAEIIDSPQPATPVTSVAADLTAGNGAGIPSPPGKPSELATTDVASAPAPKLSEKAAGKLPAEPISPSSKRTYDVFAADALATPRVVLLHNDAIIDGRQSLIYTISKVMSIISPTTPRPSDEDILRIAAATPDTIAMYKSLGAVESRPGDAQEWCPRHKNVLLRGGAQRQTFYPEAEPFLRFLHQRGIPVGIVASDRERVESNLSGGPLEGLIGGIVGDAEAILGVKRGLGSFVKAVLDPWLVKRALIPDEPLDLANLGSCGVAPLKPEEILVVSCSPYNLYEASVFGAKTVWVKTSGAAVKRDAIIDEVVDDLQKLTDLMKRHDPTDVKIQRTVGGEDHDNSMEQDDDKAETEALVDAVVDLQDTEEIVEVLSELQQKEEEAEVEGIVEVIAELQDKDEVEEIIDVIAELQDKDEVEEIVDTLADLQQREELVEAIDEWAQKKTGESVESPLVQMGGLETHQDETTPAKPQDIQAGLSKPFIKAEADDKSRDVIMHSIEGGHVIPQHTDADEDVLMTDSIEDQQREPVESKTTKHNDALQGNMEMQMDIDGHHKDAQGARHTPESISPQKDSDSSPRDVPSSQTTISPTSGNGKNSSDDKADRKLSNATRDTDSPLSDVPSIIDLSYE